MSRDEAFPYSRHSVARSGPGFNNQPGGSITPVLLPSSEIAVRMEWHGNATPGNMGVPSRLIDWSQLIKFDYNPPGGPAEPDNTIGDIGIYENWFTNFFGGPYKKYMFSYGFLGTPWDWQVPPSPFFDPGLWYDGFPRDIKYRLLFGFDGVQTFTFSVRSISVNAGGAPTPGNFNMSVSNLSPVIPGIDPLKISQVYPITSFKPVFTFNGAPPSTLGWALYFAPVVAQYRRALNVSDTAWFNSPLNF